MCFDCEERKPMTLPSCPDHAMWWTGAIYCPKTSSVLGHRNHSNVHMSNDPVQINPTHLIPDFNVPK